MTQPDRFVGNAPCPLCGSTKARVNVTKSGLTCLTCNSCNCQLFTRSDRSDELLRALILRAPDPAPATEPEAKPAPSPQPEAKASAKPAAKKGADSWAPF